ncbi:MAG TPA: K(+)-transporting ATPase subunit C [Candidatus Paceibacterota bacterium]|nr:K(+)-transporting ATPase subunit C [Candidatus Paceibacterota bacterium]
MKSILTEFGRSIVATIFFAVILCGLYPLIVYGAAQLLFHNQANGSLLVDKSGAVRGSALLAQNFTGAQYFHPRPSAAGANGYDATSSGGSNLGPTSSNLVANITQNIANYRAENNLATNTPLPADAVTASASGLDPDISPANAEIQIARVARARGISEEQLRKLVQQNTSGRDLGLFGEPRVNVMTLNFALDQMAQK